MKFNDREIAVKGLGAGECEGVLCYLRPQMNDWANWYSQPTYKERKFKLVANLLFYYRIDEVEPLGVFVLENFTVQPEKPFHGVAFPFSIEFADELQRKHIFSCRCQKDVEIWVQKLKSSSYEYWRTELSILQKKITMRTGQDPLVAYSGYAKNQSDAEMLDWSKPKTVGPNKSSFRCHIVEPEKDISQHSVTSNGTIETADLIQF